MKEYVNRFFNMDNLDLMKELSDNSIDLIYCDVLYGTGRDFGDYKDISCDKETIYNFYQPRVNEMYRILKKTGSIYLQCDWKINHHLREIMDDIFGVDNFKNVIVWQRSNGKNNSTKNFENATDTIIFYTKSDNYTFNVIKKELKDSSVKRYNKVSSDGRRYMVANLMDKQSFKGKPDIRYVNGKEYISKDKLGYKWNQAKFDEELKNGTKFVENSEGNIAVIKYLDDSNGANVDNIWNDIYCIVSTDTYATQKPKELISRIIQASSNKGDIIADFFCGSGTACVVAKELERNYIGCDIGKKAISIATKRINLA